MSRPHRHFGGTTFRALAQILVELRITRWPLLTAAPDANIDDGLTVLADTSLNDGQHATVFPATDEHIISTTVACVIVANSHGSYSAAYTPEGTEIPSASTPPRVKSGRISAMSRIPATRTGMRANVEPFQAVDIAGFAGGSLTSGQMMETFGRGYFVFRHISSA